MLPLACENAGRPARLDGHEILRIALMVSLPTMGLDQFLRTPPSSFPAGHWITDSLMALPLFAAGCWAGDRLASRAGLGTGSTGSTGSPGNARSTRSTGSTGSTGNGSDIAKRALITSLFCVLFLAPVWFVADKTGNPLTAQPIVFPHASGSGDMYSVSPGIIIALACVCLVPAAFWLGRAVTPTRQWPGVAVALLLAGAAPVLAWLLYRLAAHAYASQVYYAGSAPAARRHLTPTIATTHLTPAPFAVGYQIAHALQDGLAGQAAGLPAAALALLIPARRPLPARIGRQVHPTAHEEAPE